MAATTQLQMVNRLLRRLREPTVTSVSSNDYAQLIGDFVNQIIVEVGDAIDWRRDITQVTAYTGDNFPPDFSLGKGSTYVSIFNTFASGRSRPVFDGITNQPLHRWQYALYDPDIPGWSSIFEPPVTMKYITNNARLSTYQFPEPINSLPRVFAPEAFSYTFSDSEGVTVHLSQRIRLNSPNSFVGAFYVPQDPLALDGTDDSTLVRYDSDLVFLGAYYLALNERGEEMGEAGSIAEKKYILRLSQFQESEIFDEIMVDRYEVIPD